MHIIFVTRKTILFEYIKVFDVAETVATCDVWWTCMQVSCMRFAGAGPSFLLLIAGFLSPWGWAQSPAAGGYAQGGCSGVQWHVPPGMLDSLPNWWLLVKIQWLWHSGRASALSGGVDGLEVHITSWEKRYTLCVVSLDTLWDHLSPEVVLRRHPWRASQKRRSLDSPQRCFCNMFGLDSRDCILTSAWGVSVDPA